MFNEHFDPHLEIKVRNEEHFGNLTTHPIQDTKYATYSQYSSVYVNNDGEGYIDEEITNRVNNQKPESQKIHYRIKGGKIMQ